ncbi:unnamed protein product [Linum trigynum]|uniref:Uncharacterized protein n=1 Tax=Linum trigynum TaxID=586398 RepID=A0AAV2E0Y7_9ROSI
MASTDTGEGTLTGRRLPLKLTESRRRDGDGLTEFNGQRSGDWRNLPAASMGFEFDGWLRPTTMNRVRRLASTGFEFDCRLRPTTMNRVRRLASTGFEFDGWLRPTTMNGGGGIGGR